MSQIRAVPRTIWVPASVFGLTVGAPTLGTQAARWRVWQFDSAAVETVSAPVEIPSFWLTMDVDFYWSNMGAGAGDVRWAVSLDRAGDGEAMGVSNGGGSAAVTITAPAQDVVKKSRLLTAHPVDATKLLNVRPSRTGTDAADTLANDASLIGVRFRRVTATARPAE